MTSNFDARSSSAYCSPSICLLQNLFGLLNWERTAYSVDGIATRYELDGPGIECQWRPDFPHLSRPALEPIQTPYSRHRISYPGVKWSGRGTDHPPESSVEVKETVELQVCSPSGLSWLVLGRFFFCGTAAQRGPWFSHS